MVARAYPRSFVPEQFDASDFVQIEPLYQELTRRPLGSVPEMEKWLADLSELSSAVDEYGNRRYIDKSCHTDDPEVEKRFLHYVEHIEPKIKPMFFRLQKKFLESPFAQQLKGNRYQILKRKWQADVELFREENVPLEVDVTKQVNEYDKLCGAMMITHEGKEYTLQQAAKFIEQPDRAVRQKVWELTVQRRLKDRDAMERIFDGLLKLRQRIAANAGLKDFRAYQWKANKRFDYAPEDCLKFGQSIERVCVPLAREMDRQRQRDLGLDRLRPWDLSVDPKNRMPLKPFEESQVDRFVDKTKEIIGRLSPELADDFESLRKRKNLDLASRKGKQPGGYQATLEEAREPFIFMNAAGLQRDVEVLLHEGGHAFHTLAARSEPLMFLRSAPMEFCEVASMSMELLGAEHFEVFYDDSAHSARARRTMLEGIVAFFPWMATIDLFQHWLYMNPGHSPEQRKAHWLELMERFGRGVDWSGYEAVQESRWQAQLHLFHAPFYYVEYGIAQLGALQLWMKSRQDARAAVANYRAALALGGTRPLPELFAVAGIQFDFSEKTLTPLMRAIGQELERLPR